MKKQPYENSIKQDVWYSCHRKISYRSEKSAENVIKMKRKHGTLISHTLTIYPCDICCGWHIGHERILWKKTELEEKISNELIKGPCGNIFMTISFLNKYRKDVVFVFGDNLEREGLGGQARVARKVQNAYGFITKKKASDNPEDYYKIREYKSVYKEELVLLKKEIEENNNKWFLIPTLGAGIANKYGIWQKIIRSDIRKQLKVYPNIYFLYSGRECDQ